MILVQSAAEEEVDKDLVRGAYSVSCDPLPAERALKWLARRAGSSGCSWRTTPRRICSQAVGSDLGAVAAELQKLAALPPETPLTAEQVGGLVGVRHGETIYDWRDAVLDGDGGRAVDAADAAARPARRIRRQADHAARHDARRGRHREEPLRPQDARGRA